MRPRRDMIRCATASSVRPPLPNNHKLMYRFRNPSKGNQAAARHWILNHVSRSQTFARSRFLKMGLRNLRLVPAEALDGKAIIATLLWLLETVLKGRGMQT
jgi:hypothetical protein